MRAAESAKERFVRAAEVYTLRGGGALLQEMQLFCRAGTYAESQLLLATGNGGTNSTHRVEGRIAGSEPA